MPSGALNRLSRNKITRDWISQPELRGEDFILPYFVVEGENVKRPIGSMPGIYHLSIDNLIRDIQETPGLRAVILFGVIEKKDDIASESYRQDGLVQKAVKEIKKNFSGLIVITDVCLCGYTSHGHCGIIGSRDSKVNCQGLIDNDATLKVLARIALSHAKAGADLVAPSAMTKGQVGVIRKTLDKHGFTDTGILAYSVKYASNFYRPFRDALNSAPEFGDRKSYQLDFRDPDEALKRIEQDISEGADIVMVKPALAYLDIVYRAKEKFKVPVAAYNVSGEYAMIKKMSNGDEELEKDLALETLTSIKRAGADFIVSYFGKEIIKWTK